MPVVRVSRDKRGYEHVYLIHVPNGADRPRLLYWFRTPPGVKVGRDPLDAATRRALESGNPEVAFDWRSLVVTQPGPEQPNWRERRLAARAVKRARTDGDGQDTASDSAARPGNGKSRGKRRRNRGQSAAPVESSVDAAKTAEAPTLQPAESTDPPSETS